MDGKIAKKIFLHFLKKHKLIGIASAYFTYGKPYDANIPTNIEVLNENAIKADTSKETKDVKIYLINMLGDTRGVQTMVQFDRDYLYDIYMEWNRYILTNWYSIHKKYYTKIKK